VPFADHVPSEPGRRRTVLTGQEHGPVGIEFSVAKRKSLSDASTIDQSPQSTCMRSTRCTRGGGVPRQGMTGAAMSWCTTTWPAGESVRIRSARASTCSGRGGSGSDRRPGRANASVSPPLRHYFGPLSAPAAGGGVPRVSILCPRVTRSEKASRRRPVASALWRAAHVPEKVWRRATAAGGPFPTSSSWGRSVAARPRSTGASAGTRRMVPARHKELHYFDLTTPRGGLVPGAAPARSSRTGDGRSVLYLLFHPLAPGRAAHDLPASTRFVVLLRDPVQRAISHYWHDGD